MQQRNRTPRQNVAKTRKCRVVANLLLLFCTSFCLILLLLPCKANTKQNCSSSISRVNLIKESQERVSRQKRETQCKTKKRGLGFEANWQCRCRGNNSPRNTGTITIQCWANPLSVSFLFLFYHLLLVLQMLKLLHYFLGFTSLLQYLQLCLIGILQIPIHANGRILLVLLKILLLKSTSNQLSLNFPFLQIFLLFLSFKSSSFLVLISLDQYHLIQETALN